MALTIEDGSVVTGADSYITATEYQTWADARFGAGRSTAPADDAAAELLIRRAMDFFETLDFVGYLVEDGQPLQWPRSWVTIDRYAVETTEIPKEVKNSLYELTYAEETGEGEMDQVDRKVASERVGPISVSYDNSSASRVINTGVHRWLRKLLSSAGGTQFEVNRA